MLVFFMYIWSILQPFGNFCGHFGLFHGHLVYFPRFGMLYKEKSGNPAAGVDFPMLFAAGIIPQAVP
jgi:hypothetical protein